MALLADRSVSLETIYFQKDDFPKRLTKIIDEIYDYMVRNPTDTKAKIQNSDYPGLISKMIFDRFGVLVNFIFNTRTEAETIALNLNNRNVLSKNIHANYPRPVDFERFANKLDAEVGTVDLKKAKISGFFSKYTHNLWFNIYDAKYNATLLPEEVCAVILHEIGHIFTYIEYSNRLMTTNQVLGYLSNALKKEPDVSKHIYIYKEAAGSFSNDPDFFDDIVNEKNRAIIGYRFYKKILLNVRSQLPDSKYDETSGEVLADSFASRFGVGKYIVTALDKVTKHGFSIENSLYTNKFSYMLQSKNVTQKLIDPSLAANIFIGFVLAEIVILLYSIVVIMLMSGESYLSYNYDELQIRYKRIRNDYVQRLSFCNLPKQELAQTLADVKEMDAIISKTPRLVPSMFTKFSNWIFSDNKKAIESIQLQQLLEEIAHNDLFLKSAELRLAITKD